ncbi:hypothetical protein [Bacteroidetes bacterium endosymbiont of Geopemphigus sp.]|uniref:hypothetical protein n=1 Tax=Bacteroidetes bacterium endosymbiont of Geopemphigus sp. TaxID=2047937 RepID=UPI000CD16EC9|nr:hypothetical protein [Bacteroidetes bacterium endosymbiont of Geopemphigus sp.]
MYSIGKDRLYIDFNFPLVKYQSPNKKSYKGKGSTLDILVKRDESTTKYDYYGAISEKYGKRRPT